jgi:hypothetical protein
MLLTALSASPAQRLLPPGRYTDWPEKTFFEEEKQLGVRSRRTQDAQNFPLKLFVCPLHSSSHTFVLPSLNE